LGQLRIENYLLVVNHLDGLIRRSWPLARTEGRSFGARVVRQSEADDVIQIAQGIASIITAVVDTIPMVRRWADVLAQTELKGSWTGIVNLVMTLKMFYHGTLQMPFHIGLDGEKVNEDTSRTLVCQVLGNCGPEPGPGFQNSDLTDLHSTVNHQAADGYTDTCACSSLKATDDVDLKTGDATGGYDRLGSFDFTFNPTDDGCAERYEIQRWGGLREWAAIPEPNPFAERCSCMTQTLKGISSPKTPGSSCYEGSIHPFAALENFAYAAKHYRFNAWGLNEYVLDPQGCVEVTMCGFYSQSSCSTGFAGHRNGAWTHQHLCQWDGTSKTCKLKASMCAFANHEQCLSRDYGASWNSPIPAAAADLCKWTGDRAFGR